MTQEKIPAVSEAAERKSILVEPNVVPEIYIDGIVDFIRVGACTKIIFYSEMPMDGEHIHRVVGRMTIQTNKLRQIAMHLQRSLGSICQSRH